MACKAIHCSSRCCPIFSPHSTSLSLESEELIRLCPQVSALLRWFTKWLHPSHCFHLTSPSLMTPWSFLGLSPDAYVRTKAADYLHFRVWYTERQCIPNSSHYLSFPRPVLPACPIQVAGAIVHPCTLAEAWRASSSCLTFPLRIPLLLPSSPFPLLLP